MNESGGAGARKGFAFQDYVLAERLLQVARRQRIGTIAGTPVPVEPTFGIEYAPGSSSPEWDVVEYTEREIYLEEVKRGGVPIDERRALWKRLRRTAGRLSEAPAHILLTVNSDEPPAQRKLWGELSTFANSVDADWPLAPRPSRGSGKPRRKPVSTAEDMAREAFTILTSPDADENSPPLDETVARKLLATFRLNEASEQTVRKSVAESLKELSHGLAVRTLMEGLRGAIAMRAESSPNNRRFTASELLAEQEILAKLSEVRPEAVRLWKSIRSHTWTNTRSCAALGVGLHYRDWRLAQPSAASAIQPLRATAFIGRGGLGKSVMLREILAEHAEQGGWAVYLPAHALDHVTGELLAEALELGRAHARAEQARIMVGVDGVENWGAQRLRELTAALSEFVDPTLGVMVTCRELSWRGGLGEAPGWTTAEVAEWPIDVVSEYTNAGARKLDQKLLHLLQTPLMLDLFLRTFPEGKLVPGGVQTRHGLLKSYWSQRIVPTAAGSLDRQQLLMRIAKEEAASISRHVDVSSGVEPLVSEGVLALEQGAVVFRHSLLRDYAMQLWLLAEGAQNAAARISRIQPRLVQLGAIRGLVESLLEPSDNYSLPAVIQGMRADVLTALGAVLGELDDYSNLDMTRLFEAVPDTNGDGFAAAVLQYARLSNNAGCLEAIARLPSVNTSRIAHCLGYEFLSQLARFLEAPAAIEGRQSLAEALAARLMVWAELPQVVKVAAEDQGWLAGSVFRALATLAPTNASLHWAAEHCLDADWSRRSLLGDLAVLVANAHANGTEVATNLVARIFVDASGYRWDGKRLRPTTPNPSSRDDYAAFEVALLGRGLGTRSGGLLDLLPKTFMPVAVALIAGYEAEEAKREEEALAEFRQRAKDISMDWDIPMPPDDILELMRHTDELVPDVEVVLPNLPSPYIDLHDHHMKTLAVALRDRASKALEGVAARDSAVWEGLLGGASDICRMIALDLSTRQSTPSSAAIAKQLLLNDRLFLCRGSVPFLQKALDAYWSDLDLPSRANVIENVRLASIASKHATGSLLSCIPENERPKDLSVFVRFCEALQWPLLQSVPQENEIAIPARTSELVWPEPEGEAGRDRWSRLRALHPTTLELKSDEAVHETISVLRDITADLPEPRRLLGNDDLIDRLARIIRSIRKRDDETLYDSMRDSLSRLVDWSIEGLKAFDVQEVNAQPAHPSGTEARLTDVGRLWASLCELADALLGCTLFEKDQARHEAYFSILETMTRKPADALSLHLLRYVTGWFRCNGAGRSVLWGVLCERTRYGPALETAVRFLTAFSVNEQVDLLRTWLVAEHDEPLRETDDFVRAVGQHVGWAALVRYDTGGTTGAYALFDELIERPAKGGLLADHGTHSHFVSQTVFGAKLALVNGGVPFERAPEYARRCEAAWSSLSNTRVHLAPRHLSAFALWAFGAVLGRQPENAKAFRPTVDEAHQWWAHLQPIAVEVVRTGPYRELDSLFFMLREEHASNVVGAANVLELLEHLAVRTREVSDDEYRRQAINHAAETVTTLSRQALPSDLRERLSKVVSTWQNQRDVSDRVVLAEKAVRAVD